MVADKPSELIDVVSSDCFVTGRFCQAGDKLRTLRRHLRPGGKVVIHVDFKPGTYVVRCRVRDRQDQPHDRHGISQFVVQ